MGDITSVKDRLIQAIDSAHTADEVGHVAATLEIALGTCAELWANASYSYKASEIAQRAEMKIDTLMRDAHHRTNVKLVRYRDRMRSIGDMHARMQWEYFYREA